MAGTSVNFTASGLNFTWGGTLGTPSGTDLFKKEHVQVLAQAVELHDHTLTKGLAVGRIQTTTTPAIPTTALNPNIGAIGDTLAWWANTTGAVYTAVNVEATQTVTGAKTFSGAVTLSGTVTFSGTFGALTVTSASASALAVGRLGATTPAFQVDASAGTSVTGVKVTAAASGAGVTLAAISGNATESITINAKSTGSILIGTVAGAIGLQVATTVTGGLTVSTGGLTVSASGITVTGNSTVTGTLSGVTTLTATTLAGTLSTAAQANVTSVGTLTGLSVNTSDATGLSVRRDGVGASTTVTLSNLQAVGATNAAAAVFNLNNATPASVSYGLISVTSTTTTAGAHAGTMVFQTAQAGVLTTVLTLSTTGTATFAGALAVTGTLSGVTTLTATTLTGTLSTAAQPNVTSLGVIAALSVGSGTQPAAGAIRLGQSNSMKYFDGLVDAFALQWSSSTLTVGNNAAANGPAVLVLGASASAALYYQTTKRIEVDVTGIGFFNTAPTGKPTVSGSKGANAALGSLMTALAGLGLVTDTTT